MAFITTCFAEQGFCQVMHTRNEYHNRLDMNKIGEKPYDLN